MQRKIAVIAVVTVLMLASASCLSPWWTLYRMRSAIEGRDYVAFASHVDFPSLKASFKSQLVANGGGKPANDSDSVLDAFAEGIVGTLAGPVLDLVLGAAGVIEMINQGTPAITRAVISSAITKVPAAAQAPAELKATYRGWDRVAFRGAEAPEEEGSFILVRGGLWSWKLAEVDLHPAAAR
ncbi:MAG TPA: DUF2939 domain-containing protein [Noviherbaspirillum sp.]|uniref:DUF2939 domain-containing protein n=1 Tax=Noviherbaspirillum sp. TaxID=1926288 RepID=UPI002D2D4E82|nr:DUF2939 domain-containing protein [Noviherbaspirillum sp.]HYD94923.1 DUF2939 domain-containing protein [Noviherbaspirillum sp.]